MTDIGITGHRALPDIQAAASQVEAVMREIMRQFEGPYRLYSSLAEGADRLAARAALDLAAAELIVPLPLNAEQFLAGASEESRTAFFDLLALAHEVIEMPPSPTPVEAYVAAGRFILDHIDVLIVVWDGKPPRGPGGTGQMVAEARTRGLPLAWIHANEGHVTFEGLPRPAGESR